MFLSIQGRLPRRVITEAAYLVARVLWYRTLLTNDNFEEILRKGYRGGIPAEVRAAVKMLLEAIEADAGQPVQTLGEATAGTYLQWLYGILSDLNAADLGFDPTQGSRLLSILREANP